MVCGYVYDGIDSVALTLSHESMILPLSNSKNNSVGTVQVQRQK